MKANLGDRLVLGRTHVGDRPRVVPGPDARVEPHGGTLAAGPRAGEPS